MIIDSSAGAFRKYATRLVGLPWATAWALANRRGWLPNHRIGVSPHLDPAALRRWRKDLEKSLAYLEYGSGGSTIEAIKSDRKVVSVDTDARYLMAVQQKVTEVSGSKASFHPVYADIGWTQKWGRPLIPFPTKQRLALWRSYSSAPWEVLEALGVVPDFIFVDGRFRAASVLESFIRLPDGAECQFMLDDFVGRERSYGVVLQFATDIEAVGRAIVFRRGPMFDRGECARLLRQCQADPE